MVSLALIGDLHINLKYADFERTRVLELAQKLAGEDHYYVVLAGDVFDKARPSLEEQQLLAHFVQHIPCEVLIIAGNHERVSKTSSTYDYLSIPDTTVIQNAEYTVEGFTIRFVDWFHKEQLINHKADIAISHVRGTVPPHIVEEIPIAEFKDNYEVVFLGDIHSDFSPYPNVHYTNTPHDVHFSRSSPKRGYITLNLDRGEPLNWRREVMPDRYRKINITKRMTVEEYESYTFTSDALYKVTVVGGEEDLSSLTIYDNVEVKRLLEVSTSTLGQLSANDVYAQLVDIVSGGIKATPAEEVEVKRVIKGLQ